MNHLDIISELNLNVSEKFQIRATGRYYTNEKIALHMFETLLRELSQESVKKLKVIDPFAGDGRLIIWLIDAWNRSNLPKIHWDVCLFDINSAGLQEAKDALDSIKLQGISLDYTIKSGDAFKLSTLYKGKFDVVVTNPPWELIKPDNRELKELNEDERKLYIESMRCYDTYLANEFPLSQPLKKFAGWGTNLSRVGAEISYNLCRKNGLCAIVLPASFFADEQSLNIRKEFLDNGNAIEITYYPAEAKLFGKADIASSSLIYKKTETPSLSSIITIFDKNLTVKTSEKIELKLEQNDSYMVPITLGGCAIKLLQKMQNGLPTWFQLEKVNGEIWAGREIDETGHKNWLCLTGNSPRFIKGRMIERYQILETPSQYIGRDNWTPPISCNFDRVAWRDVSRPSQKRRVIATIIPKGTIAGNSLGVAYFKNNDKKSLYSLLAVVNSLCFEFQLRCHLATGHISLSAIRKIHLPSQESLDKFEHLFDEVRKNINDNEDNQFKIEAIVAREIYHLDKRDFSLLMDTFDKLTKEEKQEIIKEYDAVNKKPKPTESSTKIHNHLSSKLSDLDMRIVHSVPPGGNWKNIPESIPSKRIAQIRESYAQGKGSRSTYYGRLLSSMPSYTINTYFNRPGNGCHIHYSQDRVLSQREAARLQSFPDSFIFSGAQTAINNQIGNAVPPLLAYQIAKEVEKAIGKTGVFIDLFSGAGGMGLGFKWAGWKPLLANDIVPKFLETYSNNIHPNAIAGNITEKDIFSVIIGQCKELKALHKDKPFWILGGPPCQGFSTAGKKRTMKDERNTLFLNYKELLQEVEPDGFVFENVAGLLNMEKGKVFENVKFEFRSVMSNLTGWVLNSENFAIPQRRKRVFLIGSIDDSFEVSQPTVKTQRPNTENVFSDLKYWVSVEDALSDLPAISQGENGSHLNYISGPKNSYQRLMRGQIAPEEYLSGFTYT